MGMLNPSQFNQWFEYSFSCHKIPKTLLLVSFVLLSLGHHDCVLYPLLYIQRQRSVSLLMRLIHIFTADGRHKLYSHLLHTVCHGGVVGLLVHSVKNEVDTALKVRIRGEEQ